VYVYSFRLKNSSNLPSGQTTLTDKQRFIFDFVDNQSSYNVTIWAQYHDFYYKNGKKGIKSIFESGELILYTSSLACTTFYDVDIKTSYTFYSDTAAIQYSSSTEIQSVTVLETSCPSYIITQNEIIFNGLDSLNETYYANVVFHSTGFKDVTCFFNFKSPKSIFYIFNGSSVGFFDTFYSGSPTFFIDGDQRLNAFSGSYLNGVDYSKTITNVVADQYRNYLITFSDGSCSKSEVTVIVTGTPSTYFENYIVPCANLFYTNTTSHTVSNCTCYSSVCTSSGEFYISGTSLNSNPIVFDNSIVISSGSGTKSLLVKYSSPSKFEYCIIADSNSGPGLVAYTRNGPVLAFPVTSTTNLFCVGSTATYSTSGISIVQLSTSGNFSWRYNINDSGLTLDNCVSTYFDNVLVSYKNSTNFYVTKLSTNGDLKWNRTFTLLQRMTFSTVQDCTFVSYTNGTSSNVLFTNDFKKINVPPNLTGVDVFDSNGFIINFYDTPTSNINDFTNKVKDTYYTPLFSGGYFSNASDFNYTKSYTNYWGVFVDGTPSSSVTNSDNNSSELIFTGQYGPTPSNVFPSTSMYLPFVNKNATFVTKIDSSSGYPQWSSYIDNVLNIYYEYSSKISASSGNVYVSGTYGPYQSNIYNADGSQFEGTLPSLVQDGIYLVKYHSNGFAAWQTYISGGSGTSNNRNCDISNKNTSNTYVLGTTPTGPADIITLYNANLSGDRIPTASGLTILSDTGGLKLFIVNYDTNGQAQWYVSMTLPTIINIRPKMTTFSSGSLLVCFNVNDASFPNNGFIQSDGSVIYLGTGLTMYKGGFMLKISPSGFVLSQPFFRIISGFRTPYIRCACSSPYDDSMFMSGDLHDDSVIEFYNTGGSSSGTTLNPSISIDGTPDCFIAKYNSSGIYQWNTYIIHEGYYPSVTKTTIQSMNCDSLGNLYVCGTHKTSSNVCTIYNSDGSPFTSSYLTGIGSGGFIVKYNSSGTCQWLVKIDTSNTEFIGSLTITPDDKIVLSGTSYGNNVKFYDSNGGEHNSYQPSSASRTFSYCVKYDTNGFLVPV
jgi:hypothetical protein